MRAFVVVTLCLFAPVALAQSEKTRPVGAVSDAPADTAVLEPEAQVSSDQVPVQTRVFAAVAAALGGGGGVLLALPLTVPIIYLAALVQVPAAAGALPLLLAVPLLAALGSGGAVSLFSEGAGPWITGIASGAAAGLTTLVVGALVVPQRPSTLLDLHLGVLSVVVVPSLAAAVSAAALAPFFVPVSARTDIE